MTVVNVKAQIGGKLMLCSPSSSLPIMEYLSNPLRFLCVPRPKSSLVHCRIPLLSITLQGRVTLDPSTAVWSCGSIANFCSRICPAAFTSHSPAIRRSRSRNLCDDAILIVLFYLWKKEGNHQLRNFFSGIVVPTIGGN